MRKVFISYSHSDAALAKRMFDALKAGRQLDPWLDKESLIPGMAFRPAIRKAIREADYFLALISSRSAGRGFRNSELEQALEIFHEFPPDQVFLIPIRLDECDMPRDELLELHRLDLFPEWEQGMLRLLSVLEPAAEAKAASSAEPKISNELTRYHYRVGLVDLDLGLTNLKSIAQSLNTAQAFFHFMCPEMPSIKEAVMDIGGVKHLSIFRIPQSFIAEHPYLTVDLVACLTRYPLSFLEDGQLLYNYFAGPSDKDERFLFVSTDQLYGFCKQAGRTFEEGLVHTLVGQLTAYFTKLDYHAEIRGCVMDFCEIRADQIVGLERKEFCDECHQGLADKDLKSALDALLLWNYGGPSGR